MFKQNYFDVQIRHRYYHIWKPYNSLILLHKDCQKVAIKEERRSLTLNRRGGGAFGTPLVVFLS